MENILWVNLKSVDNSYPIHIDSDSISELNQNLLNSIKNENYLVIISQKVYKFYKKEITFDKKHIFVLKDGEEQKNFSNYKKITYFAQKLGLDRKSYIVAIGGGVVGDLAGFVAATYMRGINFIQVPTTLLACVDSSVGGKVAIDTEFGKNLIGSFYQPQEVFINLNFLLTLDKRQYQSGLAEILKYAFIENNCNSINKHRLMDFLLIHYDKILNKDFIFLEKVIKMCLDLKIAVVNQDEKEQNLRKILNFGHTYAHALEKITNYKKFTHGEAVAYGMFFIFEYARNNELIDERYKNESLNLLEKYGFKNKKLRFNKNKLIAIMKKDKKNAHGNINLIVPISKGSVMEHSFCCG